MPASGSLPALVEPAMPASAPALPPLPAPALPPLPALSLPPLPLVVLGVVLGVVVGAVLGEPASPMLPKLPEPAAAMGGVIAPWSAVAAFFFAGSEPQPEAVTAASTSTQPTNNDR